MLKTTQSALNILLKYINSADTILYTSVPQIMLIGIVTVILYVQNIVLLNRLLNLKVLLEKLHLKLLNRNSFVYTTIVIVYDVQFYFFSKEVKKLHQVMHT